MGSHDDDVVVFLIFLFLSVIIFLLLIIIIKYRFCRVCNVTVFRVIMFVSFSKIGVQRIARLETSKWCHDGTGKGTRVSLVGIQSR
jgi:hypothetical protein